MAQKKITIEERLYTDADGKIVKGDSSDAAFLFATPGKEITVEEAERAGLVKPKKKQAARSSDKQAETPANKSRKSAASTKSKG